VILSGFGTTVVLDSQNEFGITLSPSILWNILKSFGIDSLKFSSEST
jgi:hypothetical protein